MAQRKLTAKVQRYLKVNSAMIHRLTCEAIMGYLAHPNDTGKVVVNVVIPCPPVPVKRFFGEYELSSVKSEDLL
jgi:hypothetical protein